MKSDGGMVRGFSWDSLGAREIDCWASGERVCRFVVKPDAGSHGE